MTQADRDKWNVKYQKYAGDREPSKVLANYISLAPKGTALDLACGNGRNSLFLAQEGFRVDAVDISDIALDGLAGKDERVHVICEDLDTWQIPENRYELIASIKFTDRRLFPMIQKGLKPGGMLIFESFTGEKKDYCLGPNELLEAFRTFHVVYYEVKDIEEQDKFDQAVFFVALKKES